MSGTTQDWNGQPGVPGGRLESEAAVRQGLAEAMSAVQASQAAGRTFFESFGPAVSAGHADTAGPGGAGSRG